MADSADEKVKHAAAVPAPARNEKRGHLVMVTALGALNLSRKQHGPDQHGEQPRRQQRGPKEH